MSAAANSVPAGTPGPEPPKKSYPKTPGEWQKWLLELARELAGLPTLVAVITNFFTENQKILAISAAAGLLAAITLRFVPGLSKRQSILTALPWLLAMLCTLILLIVVLPNRLTEENKLLASSWLDWQKNLEKMAGTCAKNSQVEKCLSHNLAGILGNRPKPIKPTAITQLASDVVAGQLLIANATTRNVLSDRLSVDDRFIGTGFTEPVGSTNADEATVSNYFVPNITETTDHVWVWKIKMGQLLDGKPVSEQPLRDVLLRISPVERKDKAKFRENWQKWIKDHLAENNPHTVFVRFAQLDLNSQKPSGCLGRKEATRVFMNGLGDVIDKKVDRAFKDSGHTLIHTPDESNVWLFMWVYVPAQEGIAVRGTWDNLLNNFTEWIAAGQCPVQ